MGAIGWAAATYVAVWLLAVPFTLLHELGHALTALAVGVRRVTVHVGRPPTRALSVGRLELRIRLLNDPRWAWFGIYELPEDEKVSRRRLIVVHAAGPVVTAIVLLGLLAGTAFVPRPPVLLLWVLAWAVAFELFVTAVPMPYPRWFGPYACYVSDGSRIARLVRSS